MDAQDIQDLELGVCSALILGMHSPNPIISPVKTLCNNHSSC